MRVLVTLNFAATALLSAGSAAQNCPSDVGIEGGDPRRAPKGVGPDGEADAKEGSRPRPGRSVPALCLRHPTWSDRRACSPIGNAHAPVIRTGDRSVIGPLQRRNPCGSSCCP
jgi:hypothetical protein